MRWNQSYRMIPYDIIKFKVFLRKQFCHLRKNNCINTIRQYTLMNRISLFMVDQSNLQSNITSKSDFLRKFDFPTFTRFSFKIFKRLVTLSLDLNPNFQLPASVPGKLGSKANEQVSFQVKFTTAVVRIGPPGRNFIHIFRRSYHFLPHLTIL